MQWGVGSGEWGVPSQTLCDTAERVRKARKAALRTPHSAPLTSPRGFSLLEVMVAGMLLAIAVLGTGYLFVEGQSLTEEAGWARAAHQEAVSKMKTLQGNDAAPGELTSGTAHSTSVHLDRTGAISRTWLLCWWVTDVDDPANGVSSGQVDYKEILVIVGEKSDCSDAVPLARLVGLRAQ